MENKNKKILLIEDEKMIVDLLRRAFEDAGYDVAQASDGEEGLSMIGSYHPDVIVLDLLLPKKSGFGIVQDLHDSGTLAVLPVVVLSNSGQTGEVESLIRLGVQEVLTKIDFNPAAVVDKVGAICSANDVMQENHGTLTNTTPSDVGLGQDDHGDTGNSQKPHVMIIEDDPFIGDIMLKSFEKYFEAYKVVNTTDADETLANHKIDVLVLDVMLPGKDGITYLKELRQRPELKELLIVLASNLGQKEDVENGMESGADDYIIKANYLPEEIAQRVGALIAGKTSRPS